MNIKIVCPTRGLIYAQTLQSLKDNDLSLDDLVTGVGDLPHIQNELTQKALDSHPDYVLFVEDDMVLPPHTLSRMIKELGAITTVEYPLDNGYSTVVRHGDEVLWCGLGCTLVNRRVLFNLGTPYFTTDHSYRIKEDPFSLERIEVPNKYGGHDINFCMKAKEMGYEIKVVQGIEAKHLRSDALQRKQTNNGAYEIKELEPIQIRHRF